MSLCAVIPAAGRGTRLGADRPKILVEVAPDLSIWDVLSRNVAPFADCIDVILSPEGKPVFESVIGARAPALKTILNVQPEPKGMGHAIFCAEETWKNYDHILVIWGDQVHVSQQTFQACLAAHLGTAGPQLTIPLVSLPAPYVEYVFDNGGGLTHINQSREGDICTPNGWGDVGTFLLSTDGLGDAWRGYLATNPKGALTGELNFLPFMIYLSQVCQWPVLQIPVPNPDEAKGINTQDDLAFFRNLYINA